MRSGLVVLSLAACGTNGTGTVAYVAPDGHIATVDVASGHSTDLDLGVFGSVSISQDARFVAYNGLDGLPKINDREGHVTTLTTSGGCNAGRNDWFANDVFTYCVAFPSMSVQTKLVAGPGSTPRMINADHFTISHDGARIAYVDRAMTDGTTAGDFVMEDIDGTHRTTLIPDTEVGTVSFLPDDRGIVFDHFPGEPGVPTLKLLTFADQATTVLGTAFLNPEFAGGERISPDGREILAIQGGQNVVGITLATGAVRTYALPDPNVGFNGAVYLDNGRVLISRTTSVFEGDAGVSSQQLQITDGTDKKVLASSNGSSQCSVYSVSRETRQIGVTCSVPAIIDFAGELVVGRQGLTTVGTSSDGNGLISIDGNGLLEFTSTDGTSRTLATAASFGTSTVQLPAPYAAYAP